MGVVREVELRQMPSPVRRAIDNEVVGQDIRDVRRTATSLSQRYQEGHGRQESDRSRPFLKGQGDVIAYLASRAPATYAAVQAAFRETEARRGDFQPTTMVDVGAGPGTVTWAATARWPSLREATLFERDHRFAQVGQGLTAHQAREGQVFSWSVEDVRTRRTFPPADLVATGYVLVELTPGAAVDLVERLWAATQDTLVLVEPGTPRGFEYILKARTRLIDLKAHILAPCPSEGACPKGAGERWCHFAERLPRSEVHRQAKTSGRGKPSRLPFEDEKFSYVAASRHPGRPVAGRVTLMPRKASGVVIFETCQAPDLVERTVSRRSKEALREAKAFTWGSAMERQLPATNVRRLASAAHDGEDGASSNLRDP